MHQALSPARPDDEDAGTITPMMAQFLEIKAINPGYLLFYRMGDFYELFFEDAEIASAALGIVLTKRGKHRGADIPMCGVPIHAANDYLNTLIRLGHRVAICEQVEDPAEARKRGSKSVVKRDVVRLVTPGTLTEDELLPQRGPNHLAALAMLHHGEADFALAWADISTGEMMVMDIATAALGDELSRIAPAELLLSEAAAQALRALGLGRAVPHMVLRPAEAFDSSQGAETLKSAFADGSVDPTAFSRAARAALGALVAYVAETQKGAAPALRPPTKERVSNHMAIDAATRHSLELVDTQRGLQKGSLLSEIDACCTPAGSRLLARRLVAPLTDARAINARLDAVARLVETPALSRAIRQGLRSAPDLMRPLTRLSLERGGPRDLFAIGSAIRAGRDLGVALAGEALLPADLSAIADHLAAAPEALGAELLLAIGENPPLLAREGGFVAEGYDGALDGERALASETRAVVAALQARLTEMTGVKALKIRHNGVLGYYVEVPASHGRTLLEGDFPDRFLHRQTMASAMRFTTAELSDLEGRIARAHEAALGLEMAIFARLREAVLVQTEALRRVADALAGLDVAAGLAHLAASRGYCRPEIDESLAFAIEGGRHPVVETMLGAENRTFVANECDLSGGALWLVTGPNMGGKSTFLRQNALIAILAQAGSFVPAARAHIGVIDRVFSRVGASDDIAHGRSTFMVEMVETAAILNRATARSLVVLDEIGRGTATFDGLSIAWACAEALHDETGCRALFATHFHEMTSLARTLARVSNHTMAVREWEGDVVFLHEVKGGAADRSYGIQVARLAGMPDRVLKRARHVLTTLERRSSGGAGAVLDDLPLFAHQPSPPEPRTDEVQTLLDSLRPDEMSPRQALDALYDLKKARDAASRR